MRKAEQAAGARRHSMIADDPPGVPGTSEASYGEKRGGVMRKAEQAAGARRHSMIADDGVGDHNRAGRSFFWFKAL